MSEEFDFDLPPFDRLLVEERARLAQALDIGVFAKDRLILGRGQEADCLHVVIKGLVEERHGCDIVAVYGAGDVFDLKAMFGTAQTNSFVAAEDTVCHLLARRTVVDLAGRNAAFAAFVHDDFSAKMREQASERFNREMAALTMARIRDAYLHPPVFVPASSSLREAAAAMKAQRSGSVLVQDGEGEDGRARVGLLTGSDLRDLVVLDGHGVDEAVGPLARYALITLDRDDLLFNSLVLMTKHSVRRVVITGEGGTIVGVLEQIDLLGVLSNHSQVIARKVDMASGPEDLGEASLDVLSLIRTLHATGVRVPFIADLVTQINRKIFRRLFELLAPPELQANSCLIVMGSEGRGEQVLKTDQDNGLILRDGFSCDGLEAFTTAFTRHLVAFGYPVCPGGIMVSNPEWTRSVQDYKDAVYHWIHQPDEAAQLNLAIFYDAAPVAGDCALLEQARGYLLAKMQDNAGFFSHFARPVLSFDTPTGLLASLFDRKASQEIDIKKAGIFPLVHGIRALALEKRMTETNTAERVWALADANVLDRAFANELVEAFIHLSTLRLKARVAVVVPGQHIDNLVRPAEMSKMDRDQFNDCLGLVKRFKEFVSYHFRLSMH